MENRKEIISVLSEEWESTNKISKETGKNWYIVFSVLSQLVIEGIVEKDVRSRTFYWRLKSAT